MTRSIARGGRNEKARQRVLAARLSRTVHLICQRYLGQVPAPPPWRAGTLQGHIHLHRLLRVLCRLAAADPPAVAATAAAPDLGHIHEHSDTESEGSLISEEYDPFADPAPQQ